MGTVSPINTSKEAQWLTHCAAIEFAAAHNISKSKPAIEALKKLIHEEVFAEPGLDYGEVEDEIAEALQMAKKPLEILQAYGPELFAPRPIPVSVYGAVVLGYCEDRNIFENKKVKKICRKAFKLADKSAATLDVAKPNAKAVFYTFLLDDINYTLSVMETAKPGSGAYEQSWDDFLNDYLPKAMHIPRASDFERQIHGAIAQLQSKLNPNSGVLVFPGSQRGRDSAPRPQDA